MSADAVAPGRRRPEALDAKLLLLTALIIAVCGLVYELLAGTLASYLLGDSVMQFSTVIGLYLSAMGLGSWLSGRIEAQVARRFVEVELGVALVGGLAAPALFLAFAHLAFFRGVLYGFVAAVGTLVGLEIPLLLRVLRDQLPFKDLIARVLTVDYLGALLASLLFPLLLVPRLGLVRTGLVFGVLNAAVGLWSTHLLASLIPRRRGLQIRGAVILALLAAGVLAADRLTSLAEEGMYADEVIYARSSQYQRIVVTRGRAGFQLFLNGNLQFSSADEARYHEALVHPAMSLAPGARRVLVLGGGDGLAVRELLKYPGVEEIQLVDLDPAMTGLARTFPLLRELNRDSFFSPRVRVTNEDAYLWLEEDHGRFDLAVVDFPDPNNFALGKLYTTHFYRLLRRALAPGAPVVVQGTSPLMARSSYWCVAQTLEAAGLVVRGYHAAVPSFGEWGFLLARDAPFEVPSRLPRIELRFLNDAALGAMFVFPADMSRVPTEVNRLDNQILVQYYEHEWKRWN
ncbi:MAG TPA: polyamine aminopropyltransferase [Myxococcaceae bacterium]|nr:polyamine aminopropyltransferase [Myxococcaceae bacterium]